MANDKRPKLFVNLHGHSCVGSIGDAIGLPQEHMDYAISNGMDGLALTDHGTMAGISHQQLHLKKLESKGIKFKGIPGIEAYFVDSLTEWNKLVQVQRTNKALQKAMASIGNEHAEAEADLDAAQTTVSSEDEEGGTLVEIESETKSSNKFSDPITQRNHLVLLPKNNTGLKALFQMVSESYIDGFYRYPRMDFDMIKRHAKGNIVASSACIGGKLAKVVFDNQNPAEEWRTWKVTDYNLEKIQAELKAVSDRFVDALGGPENYYVEIQMNKLGPQHLVNYHLMELSKRTGLKLLMTVDSHYSNPAHWREREIYKAMAWSSKTKGSIDPDTLPKTIDELKCELYPKNAEQIWAEYTKLKSDYPFYDDQIVCDAIERSYDIAHNLIGDVSIDRKVKLPAIGRLIEKSALDKLLERFTGMSEDDLAFKQLVVLAVEGMRKLGRGNDDEYIARLKNELETIKHLKFAKYFLTYHKIMAIVGDHMLIGNGRGSAAGSLLAYTLNITQVDPIRFGLLWERFLVRSKKGYPDIDSDFSDRDKAVKLLIEFFGAENVIPVSNFAQLQLRSLIKDVARLHNLPFEEINSATGKIEAEVLAAKKTEPGFDRGVWVLTFEDAMTHSESFQNLMEAHPEFQGTIQVLFKQMRGLSRHAGGVIITENSREGMPLIKAGGELQTPWPEGVNYRHLEEFGLLKFDILGLGTLRMFEQCVQRILVKQGNKHPTFKQVKDWFWKNLHPDNNPMTDTKVYENVFWNGNFSGTFQFVQQNVQSFMMKMKPICINDIAVATSIFRPGPLGLKVDRRFLNNRENPDEVIYKHPLLREVFAETSGLLVFQEQLQMIYHKLAGVPLEETDGIRKAFTKKEINNKEKAQAERNKLRQSFIDACLQANNIDAEDCGEMFDEMEKLVAYSFNKSHAVCYAITSWQCAWFLTYYPDEWIATYIDYCAISKGKVTGKEDPKAIAIKEAKSLGYTLAKPDINASEYEIVNHPTIPRTLVPSFSSLKHVGKTAVSEIQQFRPYNSAKDLLINNDGTWRHSKFNKSALSALIKMEALETVGIVGEDKPFKNYRQVHAVLVDKYDTFKRIASRKKNNDVVSAMNEAIAEVQALEDWTKKEKLEFTKELAGSVDFDMIVSPETREKLDELGFECIDNWEEKGSCWAIVASAVIAQTKTGKNYLKLRLFGETNKEVACSIWGWRGVVNLAENDVIVGLFDKNSFGFSAFQNKIYKVN